MAYKRKPGTERSDNPKPAMRAQLIAFAHLYRGGEDGVRGNQVACYKALHPRASDNTAASKATHYFHHPIVQEILAQKTQELCEQADITEGRILQEMARLAFFDVRKLLNDDGSPKGITELDDETAAAVVGLDLVSIGNSDAGLGSVMKYKLADKKGALELLGKHLKLWTDKVEASINGGKTLSDLVKEARDESE